MRKAGVILAVLALLSLAAGEKPRQSANLRFVVLKDYNGNPVRNASIILHEVDARGRQGQGGLQLKTDNDGRASYAGIPYGKLRIQVIAPGFQTYGQDHDINQPEHEFIIKLKRPQEQHSIYK
ncbi:MAG TPA: carboxypeptidase-like regulatory domain-containing protein [Terriglobales bacterium]|nr:carboxypeptidase-like regulatory domain-containing protein [Terriglobales bacterium]